MCVCSFWLLISNVSGDGDVNEALNLLHEAQLEQPGIYSAELMRSEEHIVIGAYVRRVVGMVVRECRTGFIYTYMDLVSISGAQNTSTPTTLNPKP